MTARHRHPLYGRDHYHPARRKARSEPVDEARYCPSCGTPLPESDSGLSPCLCPWCGVRVCERQV